MLSVLLRDGERMEAASAMRGVFLHVCVGKRVQVLSVMLFGRGVFLYVDVV